MRGWEAPGSSADGESAAPTVLLVDDDPQALALYRGAVADDYEVLTATTGEGALAAATDRVDVALLDRRLPDTSGDEVLRRLREAGLECRVAMVSAVEPDFDVVGMAFDDYVVKPVGEHEVRATVEELLARLEYSDLLAEHYRVSSQLAALRAAKSERALADSEEFAALRARAERIEDRVAAARRQLDDYASAFSEVDPPGAGTTATD